MGTALAVIRVAGLVAATAYLTPNARATEPPAPCAEPGAAPPNPPSAPTGRYRAPPEENFDQVVYREYPGTPFVNGPDPHDIQQGQMGNCYFMSALAGLAARRPDWLRNGLQTLPNDQYKIRLFDPKRGGWSSTTLTGRTFPANADGSPRFANVGRETNERGYELWPMFYEKAFANMANPNGKNNGYDKIGHGGGGPDFDALEVLTGQRSKHVEGKDVKALEIETFAKAVREGVVLSGTHTDGTPHALFSSKALHPEHMYWVVDVNVDKKTVTLRDPHGTEAPEKTLTWSEFLETHDLVTINQANTAHTPGAPSSPTRPVPPRPKRRLAPKAPRATRTI